MLETPRAARVLWIGSLIFAGTAILASREPESAPPVAVGSRPAAVLWAWERPELLDFIDPREVEVAVLAGTLRLESSSVQDLPRLQPLELPRAARRTAVVRIESVQGAALTPAQRRLATAAVVAWSRSYDGVQIDFDATVSERPFYRRLLEDLRRELPAAVPISMIAADPAATGSTSEGPGPEVESLLAAAVELVPSGAQVPESPAYLTAAYHRSRLLIALGRSEEARAVLDALLEAPMPELSAADRNRLRLLRPEITPALDDYLRRVTVVPVGLGWDDGSRDLLPMEDDADRFPYWFD